MRLWAVPGESCINLLLLCVRVCVCVRACVRAGVRACVGVCACAYVLAYKYIKISQKSNKHSILLIPSFKNIQLV